MKSGKSGYGFFEPIILVNETDNVHKYNNRPRLCWLSWAVFVAALLSTGRCVSLAWNGGILFYFLFTDNGRFGNDDSTLCTHEARVDNMYNFTYDTLTFILNTDYSRVDEIVSFGK